MKTFPLIISVAAIAGLVFLAAAATLGVSFPFAFVASHLVGYSCAAGVLTFFLKDYAPRTPRFDAEAFRAAEAKRESETAVATGPDQRPCPDSIAEEALATLGFCNDPATVSLM